MFRHAKAEILMWKGERLVPTIQKVWQMNYEADQQ